MQKLNIFKSSVGKYFLILCMVPVIILGILVTIFSNSLIRKIKREDTKHIIMNTANEVAAILEISTNGNYTFSNRDGVCYVGDVRLSGDYSVVDKIKEYNEVDVTIFDKDERIITTLVGTDGSRYVSTKATDVWNNHVKAGNDYFTENIDINGTSYYGYYRPIMDKGITVGMIFAGVSKHSVDSAISELTRSIMLIAFGICLASIILAMILYHRIVYIQNETLEYIQEIDAGILKHNMNPKILKRKDEYGAMSRYFVKLNDSLVNLIQKDALTGLNNRRAAMKELEHYVSEANTIGGSNFCIAIGDIDFFKKVNDTYGHNCGDEVLKMVAQRLDIIAPDEGFVARWGGEEFLIAIKGPLVEAEKKLQAIFEEVKAGSVTFEGKTVNVTMTFGLSEYISPRNLDFVISNADLLLYKGKNNGRNQIVV